MQLSINVTEQELEVLDDMFDLQNFNSDDMDELERVVFAVLRKKFKVEASKLFDAIYEGQE